MSITAPDDRISEYNPVSPTTQFAANFPVFNNADLAVFHDGDERFDFTVNATYVDGISTNARVVFANGITGNVLVIGSRAPRRSNRFQNGAPLPIWAQNAALDTLEAEMQEARRDIERAVKAGFDQEPQDLPESDGVSLLGWSPDHKLVNRPGEGQSAQEAAEKAAEAAQSAAEAEAAKDEAQTIADSFVVEIPPIPLTFNGIQTIFNLGVDPTSEGNVSVIVNGAPQLASAYSVSGTSIIFSSPPPAGTGEARVFARPLFVSRLQPGAYEQYENPWLVSSSVSGESSKMLASQVLVASAGDLSPAVVIEYVYNGDAAIGLDFIGAPGGSVPGGLYVQHKQIGNNPANNAFTHSIMAYALNDAAGDNDVIAISGRVRKNNKGPGDAAGVFGSGFNYSLMAGLVMGGEFVIYQNVADTGSRDRLNTGILGAGVALHLGAYSTGGRALALLAGDASGPGIWNYEIIDRNLWNGAGVTGTVVRNGGSWDDANYPEIVDKLGRATWHVYRGDGSFNVNANQIGLQNTATDGAAGFRAKANGNGNAYLDLMEGDNFRAQFFWDGVNDFVRIGTVGLYDFQIRTNETARITVKADGNILMGLTAKNYANDAAASVAGVPIGGEYHNAGARRIRLS